MSKKSYRGLGEAFTENNKDVNEDQASEQIIACEQAIKEIEVSRKTDSKLKQIKEDAKILGSSYSDAIKHERRKINIFLDKIAEIKDGSVNKHSSARK